MPERGWDVYNKYIGKDIRLLAEAEARRVRTGRGDTMGTEGMMTAGVVIYLCLLGNLLRAAEYGSQRYLAAKKTNSAGFEAMGCFFACLARTLG